MKYVYLVGALLFGVLWPCSACACLYLLTASWLPVNWLLAAFVFFASGGCYRAAGALYVKYKQQRKAQQELQAQRVSFAYGNVHFSHPYISHDFVRRMAKERRHGQRRHDRLN